MQAIIASTPILQFHPFDVESALAAIVAVIGLFMSAFMSGSEIAYFSLNEELISRIEDEKKRERIKTLLSDSERLLATILIGNNLVNVMIVVLSAFAMEHVLVVNSPVLSFVIQSIILTFLILLFGEIIPKLYASGNNLRFAQAACGTLEVLSKLFRPLAGLLAKSTVVVNSMVTKQADDLSVDDLSKALEISDVKAGDEKDMLRGILKFGDTEVNEIMRPRVDVVDVDYESTFSEVVKVVVETGYSRVPVYQDSPDNIKGILYAKDLLPYIGKEDDTFAWQELLRKAYFVPETRMIDDLLEDFRTKKIHMAVIVDEYGCTQGIATLEDIIEEIVGDIDDEYDTEEKFYTKLNDNTYVFDGKTPLGDFCRVTETDEETLAEAGDGVETLAGLLLALKGDFLHDKETLAYDKFNFIVSKVDRHRILKVRVFIQND